MNRISINVTYDDDNDDDPVLNRPRFYSIDNRKYSS